MCVLDRPRLSRRRHGQNTSPSGLPKVQPESRVHEPVPTACRKYDMAKHHEHVSKAQGKAPRKDLERRRNVLDPRCQDERRREKRGPEGRNPTCADKLIWDGKRGKLVRLGLGKASTL